MIPASFDYECPSSLDEALALLAEHGDEAKVLAGGHSLLPLMKLRFATPTVVIDVGRLGELSYVRDEGDHLAIGALTSHRDLSNHPLVEQHLPLLSYVAGQIGDSQVRKRGTVGGSLVHGDPASDLPAAMLATRATFVTKGPQGSRSILAEDFFKGFLETALAPEELLLEIQVPKMEGVGWSFQKLTKRAQDWAIVGVALVHGQGQSGVGLINMAPTPIRALEVEKALATGACASDAAELADVGSEPTVDLNADEEFRRHLSKVLVRRGIEEALSGSHL